MTRIYGELTRKAQQYYGPGAMVIEDEDGVWLDVPDREESSMILGANPADAEEALNVLIESRKAGAKVG